MKKYLSSLFLLLVFNTLNASHIRSGEIRIERLPKSGLWYRFTVVAIRDTEGIKFGDQGVFDFGDGSTAEGPFDPPNGNLVETPIGDPSDNLSLVVFSFEHEYSFHNFIYNVSYREKNRNANILNMNNSLEAEFLVEASFDTDALIGGDNVSPIFTTLPIDFAGSGEQFIHNLGAYDPDGDSLSYELYIPKQDKQGGQVIDVFGYVYPNDPRFYDDYNNGAENGGPPTFSIDNQGNLIWDAPGTIGEYTIAIKVTEWRKLSNTIIPIGYSVRDMQVIVKEVDNEKPELPSIQDQCLTTEKDSGFDFTVIDLDGDKIFIEIFGELGDNDVLVTPEDTAASPVNVNVKWNDACGFSTEKQIDVYLKATDFDFSNDPERRFVSLADYTNFKISLKASPPVGLEPELGELGEVMLSWTNTTCNENVEIWRKLGPNNLEEQCDSKLNGYRYVAHVDGNQSSFTDNLQGAVSPMGEVCYKVKSANGMFSDEVCVTYDVSGPILTQAEYLDGHVNLEWERSVTGSSFNVNVKYEEDDEFTRLLETSNTTFTDQLSAEEAQNALFLIEEVSGEDIYYSGTFGLTLSQVENKREGVRITWLGETPWSMFDVDDPDHMVYRGNESQSIENYSLIGTADVFEDGLSYFDKNVVFWSNLLLLCGFSWNLWN